MDSLNAARERFDEFRKGPKKWFEKKEFKMNRPPWLVKNPSDELDLLFQNQSQLFQEGVVVWGVLVQANSLLFDPTKPQSCPGEMLFSLDLKAAPDYLRDVSHFLYNLKEGPRANEEEERIGQHLANERTRRYGLKVPESISPDLPCFLSTTFFERSELPGKRIRDKVIPIVAGLTAPHFIAPLPPKFWDKELRTWESKGA